MTLLNQLQPLLSSSKLFDKGEEPAAHPNDKSKKRKWKQERIKMGQGGTLDPLADGVLGERAFFSCWNGRCGPPGWGSMSRKHRRVKVYGGS